MLFCRRRRHQGRPKNDLFVCAYTNKVKAYCDEYFFSNFNRIAKGQTTFVVDNTDDDGEYVGRLKQLTSAPVVHDRAPRTDFQFLTNVISSVNVCRDKFLESDCKHMVIIETDVIPPVDVLDGLTGAARRLEADGVRWGVIGAIYYLGYHNFGHNDLVKVVGEAVLSGCSLYNRSLIEQAKFRGWSQGAAGCFPDACMTEDARLKGYTTWNDHSLRCEHVAPHYRGVL